LWLWQTENIDGQLWHRYTVTVCGTRKTKLSEVYLVFMRGHIVSMSFSCLILKLVFNINIQWWFQHHQPLQQGTTTITSQIMDPVFKRCINIIQIWSPKSGEMHREWNNYLVVTSQDFIPQSMIIRADNVVLPYFLHLFRC
jgi:hypothetical protein